MLIQSKVFYVSLAHRYWHTIWSPEENRKAYGALASAQGVGSNFRITLSIQTDSLADFDFLSMVERTRALLDHRCLFTDEPVFFTRPSTLENITLWLGQELTNIPLPKGARCESLEIFETETLGCKLCFSSHRLSLQQKVGNLWLRFQGDLGSKSGLMLSRDVGPRAVALTFPNFSEPAANENTWLERLFNHLHAQLPQLCELIVDLGRQKALRIALP